MTIHHCYVDNHPSANDTTSYGLGYHLGTRVSIHIQILNYPLVIKHGWKIPHSNGLPWNFQQARQAMFDCGMVSKIEYKTE
jgi:hypothetical protein